MKAAIPRWRGFNIVDLFSTSVRQKEHFPMNDGIVAEEDFAMIRELGFNFVRVPMSYLFFGKGPFGRTPDPDRMWMIDRVVEFGQRHEIHVALALHRAPGYCVNADSEFDFPEKGSLFTDDDDLDDFITWWRLIAERYRDVAPGALSFDLVNEPINVSDAAFDRTFLPTIEAVTEFNPERLVQVEGRFVIADGTFALEPPTSTVTALPNVVTSVHLYHPAGLTHYQCPWTSRLLPDLEPPTWPYRRTLRGGATGTPSEGDQQVWDKEALRQLLEPYLDLAAAGNPVHVGEMGAYKEVDHDVYVNYLADVVDLLAEHQIGFAMWNFRGPFGIVDNGRSGPGFEQFHDHSLDTRLLTTLQRS